MTAPARTHRWWLVALAGLVAAAVAGAWLWRAAPEVARGFQCPMHPAVVLQRPGTCPTCGMELVERPLVAARGEAGVRRGADVRPTAPGVRYTCPMHPAFVTDDPGARCPECGMALVEQRGDAAPPPAASAPR